MMIVASEVVHTGEVHLEFNSCFLQIIRKMYPDQPIVFRSEERHARALRQSLDFQTGIILNPFRAYYDRKAYSWPKRIWGEIKTIYRTLRFGRKQKADKYVWTCLFPTGHLFLVLLLNLYKKDHPHIIVLHGELELLKENGKRGTEKFLGHILRYAMKISPSRVQYIVLGDSIRENLRPHVPPTVLEKVISILHPYEYSRGAAIRPELSTKPIRFGAIGTQMLAKNSQYLFDLASAFQPAIDAGGVSFESIGQVLPEMEGYSSPMVTAKYSADFVPQDLFEKAVEELDFVLFFYDNQSYELCASGAVFEAIKRGVPIISIENDYFKWLFRTYGAMGFLCKDLNEMKNLIGQIINGEKRSEIRSSLVSIKKFRQENDLASIASDLSTKLLKS